MRPNNFISKPVVEQTKDLLVWLALEIKQVFYSVNIEWIPF
jgi:hypothetical protein